MGQRLRDQYGDLILFQFEGFGEGRSMDTTVACLRCGTTISVPSTDRHAIVELLGDFGWQATKEGAFCSTHKMRAH